MSRLLKTEVHNGCQTAQNSVLTVIMIISFKVLCFNVFEYRKKYLDCIGPIKFLLMSKAKCVTDLPLLVVVSELMMHDQQLLTH